MPPSATTHFFYSSTHSRPIGNISVQPARFKLVSVPLATGLSSRTPNRLMKRQKTPPTASHAWDESTFRSLSVDFQPDSQFVDFDLPINITGDLCETVDTVAAELERLNNGQDITPRFKFRPNPRGPIESFRSAFAELSIILRRRQAPMYTPETQSPITTPPTQITTPLDPPNAGVSAFSNITFPSNPRYSSSSNESGPEAPTNSFAYEFLKATLFTIEDELDRIGWYRLSGYEIKPDARQSMQYTLGTQKIRAISDGGLSLYTDDNSSECHPILCIEAKRQKYAERHRMSTDYKHAAQIYAQMLGMVCDEKLYIRPSGQPDHQEAFVLHLRHATFYIFRARFPNSYLQSVSRLGSQYSALENEKVVLQRSRPFRMRKPADQAAFYYVLVRLLLYLFSGSSKAGHLNMDPWNPLYQRIHGLQKPEIQECVAVNSGFGPSKDENYFDPDEWEWHPILEPSDRPQSNSSSLAQHGSPMGE